MKRDLSFWYATFSGLFLFLQGASTLAARLIPSVDHALPALLGVTQMVPSHSLLHIATALLAGAAVFTGRSAPRFFSLGFGLFYLALGLLGIMSGRRLGLGLQDFDHPFHLLLGALGVFAFWRSPSEKPASPVK